MSIKLQYFRRRYEKQEHLHCMAFRKVGQSPDALATGINTDMLYIPQDINDADTAYLHDRHTTEHTEDENNLICENFSELPGCPFD